MRRNLFTRLFIISASLAVLPVMLFTIISLYLHEQGIEPLQMKFFFMGSVLLLMISSFIVSYFFASKTEKPLKGLIAATERFSRGDFGYRVPQEDIEDFEQVNEAFNQMAMAVSLLTKDLEDAKNYFKQLYDSVANYVIIVSPNRSIVEVNEKFLNDIGRGHDDVIGKKCWEAVYSYDKPCEEMGKECFLLEVYKDGIQRTATHALTVQGKQVIHSISYTPFKDKEGITNFVIEDIRDISGVTEMQERIKNSEKMAAVGRLISGLSHEINNPLAVISGYVQLASQIDFSDGERVREILGKIQGAAERIDRIMRTLMGFAGIDNVPMHPLSVNDALKSMLSLLGNEIGKRKAALVTELDEEAPLIMGREDVIRAFYNIALNALEAMNESPVAVLTIKTEAERDTVRITFSDTGTGAPEEIIDRLIEPFFTTKEFGRLGMGLTSSYALIKNYGGDMKIVNKNGLSVIITLKNMKGRSGE